MQTDGPTLWKSLAKKGANLKNFSQNVLELQLIYFSILGENRSSSFLSMRICTNRHFERKTTKFCSGQDPKTDIAIKVSTLIFIFTIFSL